MASERQIAANRANALKSTGPKTAAGRAKSSRNAYRHGLSLPIMPDTEALDLLARTLVRESADQDQLEAARAVAAAHLDVQRIRAVKRAATPTWPDQILDPQALTELCAIGRYERLALSRRKAARRRLDESVVATGDATEAGSRMKALRKVSSDPGVGIGDDAIR